MNFFKKIFSNISKKLLFKCQLLHFHGNFAAKENRQKELTFRYIKKSNRITYCITKPFHCYRMLLLLPRLFLLKLLLQLMLSYVSCHLGQGWLRWTTIFKIIITIVVQDGRHKELAGLPVEKSKPCSLHARMFYTECAWHGGERTDVRFG